MLVSIDAGISVEKTYPTSYKIPFGENFYNTFCMNVITLKLLLHKWFLTANDLLRNTAEAKLILKKS